MGTVNDPCLREIRFKIMINIMNCTIVTNEFCPIFHNFLQFSSIERLLTAEILSMKFIYEFIYEKSVGY